MRYVILPCIRVHNRPADGSQLQPKHAAMNKLIKTRIMYGCKYKYWRFVNSDVAS
jgi:hypothetical protein